MFFGYFYISDVIENRDVLMIIIVMLKFTQSLRPNFHINNDGRQVTMVGNHRHSYIS